MSSRTSININSDFLHSYGIQPALMKLILKSFTYIENKIGGNTSPCIRQTFFVKYSDWKPLTVKHDLTLRYIECIIFKILPLIPSFDNLYHSLQRSVESKVFLKSIKAQYNLCLDNKVLDWASVIISLSAGHVNNHWLTTDVKVFPKLLTKLIPW